MKTEISHAATRSHKTGKQVVHLLPDLTVRHTRFSPVLMIGQPRSGTTILARMLRKYLKINSGPESQFFIRMQKRVPQYGDLNIDKNAISLIRDIAKERCIRRNQFNYKVDVSAVLQDLTERHYPAIIDAIYWQFARHNGMMRWGDKTPDYIENLNLLYRMFPHAQFIHIVRDGRDVALSNKYVHFGAQNPVVAAMEWDRRIKLVNQFAMKLPTEQFFELRYEDFLADPGSVFRDLIDFLGISDPDKTLIRYIDNHIREDLKPNNFNKWKQQFSHSEKFNFERVAGYSLQHYDYETTLTYPNPLSAAEKSYWQLKHIWRKYTRSDSWMDNFYKLKLRFRQNTISIRKQMKLTN